MAVEYRFELAGVEAGQTVNKGGFQFVDGVHTHESEVTNTNELIVYLARCYNAHPVGSDALAQAQAEWVEAQGGARAPKPTPKPTVSLTDAIGSLDPDDDGHWTAQGLPAVDALSALTGGPVTRAQVEAAAKDFTRSAAKASAAL